MIKRAYFLAYCFMFSCLFTAGLENQPLREVGASQIQSEGYVQIKMAVDKIVHDAMDASKPGMAQVLKKWLAYCCVGIASETLTSFELKYLNISMENYYLQRIGLLAIGGILVMLFSHINSLKNKKEVMLLDRFKKVIKDSPDIINALSEDDKHLLVSNFEDWIAQIKHNKSDKTLLETCSFMMDFTCQIGAALLLAIFTVLCNKNFIIVEASYAGPRVDFNYDVILPEHYIYFVFFNLIYYGVLSGLFDFGLFAYIFNIKNESDDLISQIELEVNKFKKQIEQKASAHA
jgi:hypothetical protein